MGVDQSRHPQPVPVRDPRRARARRGRLGRSGPIPPGWCRPVPASARPAGAAAGAAPPTRRLVSSRRQRPRQGRLARPRPVVRRQGRRGPTARRAGPGAERARVRTARPPRRPGRRRGRAGGGDGRKSRLPKMAEERFRRAADGGGARPDPGLGRPHLDRVADPMTRWGEGVLARLRPRARRHRARRRLRHRAGHRDAAGAGPRRPVVALDAAPSMVVEARGRLAPFGDRVPRRGGRPVGPGPRRSSAGGPRSTPCCPRPRSTGCSTTTGSSPTWPGCYGPVAGWWPSAGRTGTSPA